MLRKLKRNNYWNESYLPIYKILRVVPRSQLGFAKDILKDLARTGFVLLHKGGACVSLNIRKKKEIEYICTENIQVCIKFINNEME